MMMISALNERADKFDEKEQKQLKMIEHVLSLNAIGDARIASSLTPNFTRK